MIEEKNASTEMDKKPSTKTMSLIGSNTTQTFINKWLGTPYRYGGQSISGIDCSALSQKYYKFVFNKSIERTSINQFRAGQVIRKSELELGDLVFFKNVRSNSSIDHVGIYLKENKFLHASTSSGVMISSLNQTYYKKRFVAARRLKN